jgi:hypothetical protein
MKNIIASIETIFSKVNPDKIIEDYFKIVDDEKKGISINYFTSLAIEKLNYYSHDNVV